MKINKRKLIFVERRKPFLVDETMKSFSFVNECLLLMTHASHNGCDGKIRKVVFFANEERNKFVCENTR